METIDIHERVFVCVHGNNINDILCDDCELLIDEMLAYEYKSLIDSIPENDGMEDCE